MTRVAARAALVATALVLAGCGLFGAAKPKPAALEPFNAQITGRQVWSARVGGVGFPLAIATAGGNFTVAGDDGTVLALDAQTGREVWRGNAGARLAAGVGSDGRFTAVVSRDGELVVLEAGAVKWRKPLGTRVTTSPLVAGERVFVLGVDRAVHAFDAQDGRRLWTLARPGEPLTLAQSGVLVAFKDTLVAGQGPRMAGIDPTRGSVHWEVVVASPRGTNEVENLADLVGPVVRLGDTICTRAFQSAVGCVDADRGRLIWNRNTGGLTGIGGTGELIFGADAVDRIGSWRTASGQPAWASEKFLNRGLSAPLALGPAVVFGDAEGYVHWLAQADGATQLRLPTDGTPVVGAPVLIGTTMLVATRGGGLFAFRPQ